jgi:hypothetical protein
MKVELSGSLPLAYLCHASWAVADVEMERAQSVRTAVTQTETRVVTSVPIHITRLTPRHTPTAIRRFTSTVTAGVKLGEYIYIS